VPPFDVDLIGSSSSGGSLFAGFFLRVEGWCGDGDVRAPVQTEKNENDPFFNSKKNEVVVSKWFV